MSGDFMKLSCTFERLAAAVILFLKIGTVMFGVRFSGD